MISPQTIVAKEPYIRPRPLPCKLFPSNKLLSFDHLTLYWVTVKQAINRQITENKTNEILYSVNFCSQTSKLTILNVVPSRNYASAPQWLVRAAELLKKVLDNQMQTNASSTEFEKTSKYPRFQTVLNLLHCFWCRSSTEWMLNTTHPIQIYDR
jgi:hypothetical protein